MKKSAPYEKWGGGAIVIGATVIIYTLFIYCFDFFLLPLDDVFWILGFPYKTRISNWAKVNEHESRIFYENTHDIGIGHPS